jgi:hypothetical protein
VIAAIQASSTFSTSRVSPLPAVSPPSVLRI